MDKKEVIKLFDRRKKDKEEIEFFKKRFAVDIYKDLNKPTQYYDDCQFEFLDRWAPHCREILKREETIKRMIAVLSKQAARDLMTDRYINCLSWSQIADKYYLTERNCLYINKSCINEISKNISV